VIGASFTWDGGHSFGPSDRYVQDIMGDIFSLGFGPFRWVCTSQKEEDLQATDEIAAEVFRDLMKRARPEAVEQYVSRSRLTSDLGELDVGRRALFA